MMTFLMFYILAIHSQCLLYNIKFDTNHWRIIMEFNYCRNIGIVLYWTIVIFCNFQIEIHAFSSPYTSLIPSKRRITLENDPTHYEPKYQPEFDERFNISSYFANERILRHFVRCLFYGGICDIVGRWAKPRILTSILTGCKLCTKEQKTWPHKVLNIIQMKYPTMYRALLGRFLEYMDIEIPPSERKLVQVSFEQWDDNINNT